VTFDHRRSTKTTAYETEQVNAAEREVIRAGRTRSDAAASYMHDALAMAHADTSVWFFEPLGLVRLYARIAFRLAAVAWANGEQPQ